MNRRELLQLLSALAVLGPRGWARALEDPRSLYDLPLRGRHPPLLLRPPRPSLPPLLHGAPEPHRPQAPHGPPGLPHGEAILRYYGVERGTPLAYLLSYVDFVELARTFGPIGGMGALTALIRDQKARVEAEGGKALVLDGGDTWTNSGLSLLTRGEAVVRWQNLVGVDHMVSHWEWTLGRERVEELLGLFRGEFLSYNIVDDLFGDPLFPAYRIHRVGPYALAVVGRATPTSRFPTPNPLPRGSPSPWTRGGCRRRWTRPAPRGRTPWSSSPTTGCSWTPPWRSGSGGLTSSSPATPTTSPPGPGGWGRPGSWRGAPPGRP